MKSKYYLCLNSKNPFEIEVLFMFKCEKSYEQPLLIFPIKRTNLIIAMWRTEDFPRNYTLVDQKVEWNEYVSNAAMNTRNKFENWNSFVYLLDSNRVGPPNSFVILWIICFWSKNKNWEEIPFGKVKERGSVNLLLKGVITNYEKSFLVM